MIRYAKPLTTREIAAVKDEDIDFSEIPELDASFWHEAELVDPEPMERVTLRLKRSVLDHFRSQGHGYQTRINEVLETHVRAHRRPS